MMRCFYAKKPNNNSTNNNNSIDECASKDPFIYRSIFNAQDNGKTPISIYVEPNRYAFMATHTLLSLWARSFAHLGRFCPFLLEFSR